ncbi:d-isomer specific 2-hydroxyacid dehydrogenase nad-binding protein [Ligilactobacillus equi DSM 15833 = JCM 10991]|uniref:D-isomer specific 2-hydroxyacid dehydrogenase nad-binding protein n=3 Tax=Ligilactobacillus equi TaxID=137357 RepID=V7HXX2_9LACO|nr:d-isomer specific 2-hydroxyacid dehydrogenase nad-binding protein [Ligilactobacillus equi DPC 6820]KRL82999.1 d-isomer specific 2-hydroxyacid dehydrogenase nad-binding protein [Ligilactobacillus equi DSM 15833 = JCM 10991]
MYKLNWSGKWLKIKGKYEVIFKMKIASVLPLKGELQEKLAKMTGAKVVTEASVAELAQAEIILGWDEKVSEVLSGENKIKWLQAWSAGVDNFPLAELAQKEIYLTTASGANAPGIAQQVLGYLLNFARKLHVSYDLQRAHQWEIPAGIMELTERKLLIVGTGSIGQSLAQLAQAFGMKVYGVNTYGHHVMNFNDCYAITELETVLPEADFVVNALPLTPHTKHTFSKHQFSAMSDKAYYISVGRGQTTDTSALETALKEGMIAGAALDVFEEEPLSKDSTLWDLPNILITAHTAGQTNFYAERIIDSFLLNFQYYQQGLAPAKNLVNYDLGY